MTEDAKLTVHKRLVAHHELATRVAGYVKGNAGHREMARALAEEISTLEANARQELEELGYKPDKHSNIERILNRINGFRQTLDIQEQEANEVLGHLKSSAVTDDEGNPVPVPDEVVAA